MSKLWVQFEIELFASFIQVASLLQKFSVLLWFCSGTNSHQLSGFYFRLLVFSSCPVKRSSWETAGTNGRTSALVESFRVATCILRHMQATQGTRFNEAWSFKTLLCGKKKIPHRLHPGIKTVKRTGANTCNTSEICFSQIQWTEGEGEVSLTSIQSVKTESVALGSGSFKTEVKLHCADKWLETMQLSFILLIKPTGCVLITLQVVILSVKTEPTEHWWFLDIGVKKEVKSYLKAAKNNWDTLPGRFIRYSLLVLVFRSELR